MCCFFTTTETTRTTGSVQHALSWAVANTETGTAERENLQDLRDFVSESSRRIRGCKKEGARWGHPLLLFSAAGLAAAGRGYSMTSFFVRVLLSVVTRRK